MPPPVVGALTLGLGVLGTVGGIVGSAKAAGQSEEAYKASLEEKYRAYEHNIGQTEKDIEGIKYFGSETRADIRREGDQFMRGQAAAIGASGAEIGTGSPLMTMISTAETIERDMLRATRLEELEIEKRESEIEYMTEEMGEIEEIVGTGRASSKRKGANPRKNMNLK